ncbi:MAG: Acylneuraminate cytidylyltransferase [Parcubacteria group bacterium GW2011_GWA2_49_9]|nr:MAG: Acylneuraminate cytidylyltransferase [Parcubacteria group bacterium GW2011_GWA2_49_9]
MKLLAVIPARAGSTRLRNKNIRNFCGKPLIAYAIEQAKRHPRVDRVIVDTDSQAIADVAIAYGAEAPFLRPAALATATAGINDALLLLLQRLREKEKYVSTHVLLLQATSPLRSDEDITECIRVMEKTKATTAITVVSTHPQLHNLSPNGEIVLANKRKVNSTNSQAWPQGYLQNGGVYIVKTSAFLLEKEIETKHTYAVISEKWRAVDIDTPEDFVVAEYLYTKKDAIKKDITDFN